MLAAAEMSAGGYVVAYVVIVIALFSLGVILRDPRMITPRRAARGAMKPWEGTVWRVLACAGVALLGVALVQLTVDALR